MSDHPYIRDMKEIFLICGTINHLFREGVMHG